MKPVTVLTFNEPERPEPVKTRLELAGIPAAIHDERAIQKFCYLSEPLAGIHVRVDRKDYERAQKLLREWARTDGVLRDAIHCPDCGSSRVEYPQFTRKFVLPAFGALLCAIGGLIERQFYCEDCHYTWSTKAKVLPELDLLGWPKKSPQARPHSSPVNISVYGEGDRDSQYVKKVTATLWMWFAGMMMVIWGTFFASDHSSMGRVSAAIAAVGGAIALIGYFKWNRKSRPQAS